MELEFYVMDMNGMSMPQREDELSGLSRDGWYVVAIDRGILYVARYKEPAPVAFAAEATVPEGG